MSNFIPGVINTRIQLAKVKGDLSMMTVNVPILTVINTWIVIF